MDIEESIKEDMANIGCKCRIKIAIGYQLYLHISEVLVMHDVQYFYNEELALVYVTARSSKISKPHIYVPILTTDTITIEYISDLQSNLCKAEHENRITVACMETDTTIVMYTFTGGFIDVKDPEILFRQKKREERRNRIEEQMRMNKRKIYRDAFDSGVVTDT